MNFHYLYDILGVKHKRIETICYTDTVFEPSVRKSFHFICFISTLSPRITTWIAAKTSHCHSSSCLHKNAICTSRKSELSRDKHIFITLYPQNKRSWHSATDILNTTY